MCDCQIQNVQIMPQNYTFFLIYANFLAIKMQKIANLNENSPIFAIKV